MGSGLGCTKRELLTDNGPPFGSAQFKEFCAALGIRKVYKSLHRAFGPFFSAVARKVEGIDRVTSIDRVVVIMDQEGFPDAELLQPSLG